MRFFHGFIWMSYLIQAGGSKAEFGAQGMTVAYTTSGGINRREKLREWMREVLMEHTQQTNRGLALEIGSCSQPFPRYALSHLSQ